MAGVLIGKRNGIASGVCLEGQMIAGTTECVYNNTRCKHLARQIVENMVFIMRLTTMISTQYTVMF